MSLKVIVPEGQSLLVRGTALLTFAEVHGRKVAVLVDGPGQCLRQGALEKMLSPKEYSRLIALLRSLSPKAPKRGARPRLRVGGRQWAEGSRQGIGTGG